MWRNKEFRFLIGAGLGIAGIGCALVFSLSLKAGFYMLWTIGLLFLFFLLYTAWRYRQIAKLSNYLNRIAAGDRHLDIRDNMEGELSILKNEIYKVTSRLFEQADLLTREKFYLSDTLSDISHQLKTPLTSMIMMADLLQEDSLPPRQRQAFVATLEEQLNRIQWLINALLKLSRLDAGAVQMKKQEVLVQKLVEESVKNLLIPMDIKDISFLAEGAEHVVYTGDFDWSMEALTNVVKNCVEHTPEGGQITIRWGATSLYTWIAVRDTGEGIDAKDLPHIFDRFYKSQNASPDSIGIGLALAKNIVLKQSGTIAVKSEIGKGATFVLKFYTRTTDNKSPVP